MEIKEMNLYQRINKVMEEISYLAKDDKVGTGKSSYKAISEEKVTSTVRASLIKNGLVILPVEQNTEEIFTEYEKVAYGKKEMKQRLMTRVDTKYKIVNIDKPSEYEILASSGSGVDTQDKGVGKAMTYSYKYMLLRTFAIPTGEDPDKISNEELENGMNQKITTDALIEIAVKAGYSEDALKKKYNVKDVKFIKQADKQAAYVGFKKLIEGGK